MVRAERLPVHEEPVDDIENGRRDSSGNETRVVHGSLLTLG